MCTMINKVRNLVHLVHQIREEVKEMLLKGVIQKVTKCRNQYISNLFQISKKDVGIAR